MLSSHFSILNPYLVGYHVKIIGNDRRLDFVSTLTKYKILQRNRWYRFLAKKNIYAMMKCHWDNPNGCQLFHWEQRYSRRSNWKKYKKNESCFNLRSVTQNINMSNKLWHINQHWQKVVWKTTTDTNILKTVTLEEKWTYFSNKHLGGDNVPYFFITRYHFTTKV